MKPLVVYYSQKGSNKYLAERLARELQCDVEAIRPRLNVFPLLALFGALKMSPGIAPPRHDPGSYDRIVLCGPIWMGQLISPLRDFLRKYRDSIARLFFATCCGSSDEDKDGTFGYATVFTKVREIMGEKCVACEAFPVGLVLSGDEKDKDDAVMKTRLSDSNFTGEIQRRTRAFVEKVLS